MIFEGVMANAGSVLEEFSVRKKQNLSLGVVKKGIETPKIG